MVNIWYFTLVQKVHEVIMYIISTLDINDLATKFSKLALSQAILIWNSSVFCWSNHKEVAYLAAFFSPL